MPVLAFTFTVLLLAQAGIPFTTGLWAKFYVISAAVASHSYALAIIGRGLRQLYSIRLEPSQMISAWFGNSATAS